MGFRGAIFKNGVTQSMNNLKKEKNCVTMVARYHNIISINYQKNRRNKGINKNLPESGDKYDT